jgi:hypothetical protein
MFAPGKALKNRSKPFWIREPNDFQNGSRYFYFNGDNDDFLFYWCWFYLDEEWLRLLKVFGSSRRKTWAELIAPVTETSLRKFMLSAKGPDPHTAFIESIDPFSPKFS